MRKTIMLSAELHARIRDLGRRHGLRLPQVLETMLDAAGAEQLHQALEAAARRKGEARDAAIRRRRMLNRLAATVPEAELENLLSRLAGTGEASRA